MTGYRLAVVGATGAVGQEFIRILEQRDFPTVSVRLLASARSAGRKLVVLGEEIEVEETGVDSFEGIDVALFSIPAETSRRFSPIAARTGAVVVDNSSAFRMDDDVPLVVPEVNIDDCRQHSGIIANPNCSTIQMVVALYPLHLTNPIKRIVVDTYQSVSGTGSAAIAELAAQARQVLEGQPVKPRIYRHQIAFNALPEIGDFQENGYTKEELKMVEETRKIMHAAEVAVSATCVRVPVFTGHGEAVHVEFTHPFPPAEARRILASAPGVRLLDDPTAGVYPQAVPATGTDEVYVGRIREDTSLPGGLAMWIVSDNLRKGAALNAVQIAEQMAGRGWLAPERRAA